MSVSVIFIAPFSTVNPTPLYSPVGKLAASAIDENPSKARMNNFLTKSIVNYIARILLV
jgi:hypothetical protein